MKKKQIMFFCTILTALMCTNAYAASIAVEYDYNNNILIVSGKTNDAESKIAVNILKPGIDATDLYDKSNPGDFIAYNGEFNADEQKNIFQELKLSPQIDEGEHKVYLGSKGLDKTEVMPVYILTEDSYKNIIGNLNQKTDYGEFAAYLSGEKDKIGFVRNDIIYNEENTIKVLYEYVKSNKLDKENSLNNKKVFNSAVTVDSLKNKNIMENYINSLYFKDSRIVNAYKKYVNDDKTKKYFEDLLKSQNITGIDELEKNIRDNIILTVVKHPNGIGNIKDIFTEFNDILNIDINKAGTKAYSEISGKEYSSVAACVEAFNKNIASGSGNVGGGNSSSSSSSGIGISGGIWSGTSNSTIPSTLGIKFEDLNSAQWAYAAISSLFEKGVVSGKSETLFVPNDNVTREEFVKMLICAFSLNGDGYENVFDDVDPSAWYSEYTAAAYNKGICKGMNGNKFGVGSNITRQDMCVMIYNTLKVMGIECPQGELTFDDSNEISEYAKAAVASLSVAGIVNGTGNNMFAPSGLANRAQAAVIIYNTMNYSNR